MRRACFFLLIAVLLIVGLCGCKGEVSLDYETAADKPLVIMIRYQPVSPVYNPDSPEAILYGNGDVIHREGPYSYQFGVLSPDQVQGMLDTLDGLGFFSLESNYQASEPLMGGITETVIVNLASESKKVTAQSGAEPPNWNQIIRAVEDIKPEESAGYAPSRVRLFAATTQPPDDASGVLEWQIDETLMKAANAGSRGLELEGEQASSAWKAIGEALEAGPGHETVWRESDRYYGSVYASPIFPGLSENY
jgi:hypothetical protein